jgi:hypothetical protein
MELREETEVRGAEGTDIRSRPLEDLGTLLKDLMVGGERKTGQQGVEAVLVALDLLLREQEQMSMGILMQRLTAALVVRELYLQSQALLFAEPEAVELVRTN